MSELSIEKMRYQRLILSVLVVQLAIILAFGSSGTQAKTEGPFITYDRETNTITVSGPDTAITLSDITDALHDDAILEEISPSEWLLRANLFIGLKVKLLLHGDKAGGTVDWLKMKSDASGFVWLKTFGGEINLNSTKVTSWDENVGTFDTAFDDGSGRAFILAKKVTEDEESRMDLTDSEIGYLGYFFNESYGLAWRVSKGTTLGEGVTGTVIGNRIHHNYYGAYTWGAGDMVWKGNEFFQNILYGLDPHTESRNFIVEDNSFHDNGSHGLIFARNCVFNTIRRNVSYNNGGHGIMLHESSNNNIIEDNVVYGNTDGIAIYQSSDNRIARNIVRDNVTGLRVYGRNSLVSSNNIFEENQVFDNSENGVFLHDGAEANIFTNNGIYNNGRSGVYLKGVHDNVIDGNDIKKNGVGIRIDSPSVSEHSSGNIIRGNVFSENLRSDLVDSGFPDAQFLEDNRFLDSSWNTKLVTRAAIIGAILIMLVITTGMTFIRKRFINVSTS